MTNTTRTDYVARHATGTCGSTSCLCLPAELLDKHDYEWAPESVVATVVVAAPRPTDRAYAGHVVVGDVLALASPRRAVEVTAVEAIDPRRVRFTGRDLATDEQVTITRLRGIVVPLYRLAH